MPKKNPAQISLFPEPQYHYHILLSPPDAVNDDVQEMKKRLNEMIGIPPHNFTRAHITLHDAEAPQSVDMKALLKTALAGQRKFTVKISGLHKWEKILALRLENPDRIAELAAIVKAPHKTPVKTERQTSILDKPKRKPSMTPHITLARGLSEGALDSIEDFSAFGYAKEWVCDRVTVLCYEIDGKKKSKFEIKLK